MKRLRAAFFATSLGTTAACVGTVGGAVDHVRRPFVDHPVPPLGAELGERFARADFRTAEGAHVPYRLLSPPAASAATRWPLVVVLHGSGAIGADNQAQLGAFARAWAMPAVAAAFPALVVVPQVAARSADYAPWRDGELASRPGASLPALLALIDEIAARPDVDPSRVYLVGFSMGASTALAAVLARPRSFAGVVAFSGIAPPRDAAAAVAATPQLLVHGDADSENPIGSARLWAAALSAHGAAPRLVEHVGMGHRVAPEDFAGAEWRTWLFAQSRDSGNR